jgi:hypothetical protein
MDVRQDLWRTEKQARRPEIKPQGRKTILKAGNNSEGQEASL